MPTSPNDPPARRSPRLPGYDYRRAGWYFVNVCAKGGASIFGEIAEGEMRLNEVGRIAEAEWLRTAALRPYVVPDAFAVMPNHVHLLFGLIEHDDRDDARRDMARHIPTTRLPRRTESPRPFGAPPAQSGSSVVGAYRPAVTRGASRHRGREGGTIRQGRFHDRTVRDDAEHPRIRRYVEASPPR